MAVNVILVRVSSYDVLIVGKHLLRQFLRQAVCFFGRDIILWVKAVLEVVILPAVILLRLAEQFCRFGKLLCVIRFY